MLRQTGQTVTCIEHTEAIPNTALRLPSTPTIDSNNNRLVHTYRHNYKNKMKANPITRHKNLSKTFEYFFPGKRKRKLCSKDTHTHNSTQTFKRTHTMRPQTKGA